MASERHGTARHVSLNEHFCCDMLSIVENPNCIHVSSRPICSDRRIYRFHRVSNVDRIHVASAAAAGVAVM